MPALEDAVRIFCEAEGAKLGVVAQPLRAALTGKSVSPPVFDVMAALGREEAWRNRDVASCLVISSRLTVSACGQPCHPDDASMRIIEAVWQALQK